MRGLVDDFVFLGAKRFRKQEVPLWCDLFLMTERNIKIEILLWYDFVFL